MEGLPVQSLWTNLKKKLSGSLYNKMLHHCVQKAGQYTVAMFNIVHVYMIVRWYLFIHRNTWSIIHLTFTQVYIVTVMITCWLGSTIHIKALLAWWINLPQMFIWNKFLNIDIKNKNHFILWFKVIVLQDLNKL